MAKSGITKTMILQRIVDKCFKNNIYVNRLDKLIIPQNENDLPPNMKIKSHLEYKKAYNHLYNLKTKLVKVNKPTKMVEPMKAYKEVARTGRVNEDTFTNLVNEYRQVLNLVKSTLTAEGAIEMYWESKS
tara:strand:- start:1572 stop:1961 length:390 start_codon:yes stop_codon:yes gene_type:complete